MFLFSFRRCLRVDPERVTFFDRIELLLILELGSGVLSQLYLRCRVSDDNGKLRHRSKLEISEGILGEVCRQEKDTYQPYSMYSILNLVFKSLGIVYLLL